MICKLCSKNMYTVNTCYNCAASWCTDCNKHLISIGKPILHPPELRGRIQYNCPYCNNGFIDKCKYLKPSVRLPTRLRLPRLPLPRA